MSTSKNTKSTNRKGSHQSTKGKSVAKNDYNQLLIGFVILVTILGGLWFIISNQSQDGLKEAALSETNSKVSVKKMTITQNSLRAGESSTVKLELSDSVQASTVISLSQSKSLRYTPTVTVPANANSVEFNVECLPVTATDAVTITASLNGKTTTSPAITLNPSSGRLNPIKVSVNFNTASVAKGGTSEGTVSLSEGAKSDIQVKLSSSTGDVTVPEFVAIKAGEKKATFTANVVENPEGTGATVTATFEAGSGNARLQITKDEPKVTEYAGWVVPVAVISLIIACSSLGFSLVLFFSKREPSKTVDYEALLKPHISVLFRDLKFEIRRIDDVLDGTKSDLGSVVGDVTKLRKLVNDLESNLSTSIGRVDRKIASLERSGSPRVTTEPTPILAPDPPHPPIKRPLLSVEEQLILDNINSELQQPAVLIGKVMKLTYKWCSFSETLKYEIRTMVAMHNFEIIEPNVGDRYDSVTMEYESLPYNPRYLVREVEMLGVRDPSSTGLLRAMVVVE